VNESRLQKSVAVTVLGLAVNFVLAFIKLAAGILGNSYALIADAIESFADMAASLIVWRGVVVANRPADANHPYGHGRAETLAAAAVAVMLMGAALTIILEACREILQPRHEPKPYTLFVLLGVVLIKEGLFRVTGRVGEEVDSDAVKADAWHHRSDAITSAAAALGISIALVGGKAYRSADDWAAIFAGVVIAWNGYRLLRPAVVELMDTAPEGDIGRRAETIALGVDGVRGVEKCRARKMGHEYVLDLHVEVDGNLTVTTAHGIAHAVKSAIQGQLPRVRDVATHIEPFRGARVAEQSRHAAT